METKRPILAIFVIALGLILSACGPGQMFGPTLTPTPTNTPLPTITPTAISVIPGMINGINIYDVLKANEFVYETNKLPYISGGQIWDSSNTRFNQDGFLTTIKVWDTGQVRFNIVAGQNYDKAIEVIRPIIVAVWGNDVLDWVTKHSGAAINVVQNGTIGNFNITMWTGNSFAYLDITPSNLSPDKIMP